MHSSAFVLMLRSALGAECLSTPFRNRTRVERKKKTLNVLLFIEKTNSQRPTHVQALSSYLFARWHLFRYVGYLRHQQSWPLTFCPWKWCPSVTCQFADCANFGLPRHSVLDLGPMYATDVRRQTDSLDRRQTDVRQKHRLIKFAWDNIFKKLLFFDYWTQIHLLCYTKPWSQSAFQVVKGGAYCVAPPTASLATFFIFLLSESSNHT